MITYMPKHKYKITISYKDTSNDRYFSFPHRVMYRDSFDWYCERIHLDDNI